MAKIKSNHHQRMVLGDKVTYYWKIDYCYWDKETYDRIHRKIPGSEGWYYRKYKIDVMELIGGIIPHVFEGHCFKTYEEARAKVDEIKKTKNYWRLIKR